MTDASDRGIPPTRPSSLTRLIAPDWPPLSRRRLLQSAATLSILTALERLLPAYASATPLSSGPPGRRKPLIELTIDETPFDVGNRTAKAVTINGTVPGPLVRFREGDDVTLRVVNRLHETTSLHWHGLLVPPEMDGVPGVSFDGIKGGTTFEYRFPARQSGTYWYHSHSGLQELRGVYAPLIIDPIEPEPFSYQRDYVVVLSDWTFEDPEAVIGNLKKQAGYYNFQRRTAGEFFSDAGTKGLGKTLGDFLMWSRMRMDPTDFADVTGAALVFLMNGLPPERNWTARFTPGERVRLRFINASPLTFFDVRVPGLPLTVVQADGQNVQPVNVDEFRVGPAETYDVIVQPDKAAAYTIFAEPMDRSGYARGTLAPQPGMSEAIPERRSRPLRSVEDMGMSMADMGGMEDAPRDTAESQKPADAAMDHGNMPGMAPDPAAVGRPPAGHQQGSEIPGKTPVKHGSDSHGTANQAVPDFTVSRLSDPGTGLGQDGRRVLVYTDLRALVPSPDRRAPERELELHVTGHMERFLWSFDGRKYSDAPEPIEFRHGERLRWTFVNDTMMEHPLHLHGMFMDLENGAGANLPRKHTVIVKPAERVSVAITADAPGFWAFHCHLLLHMEAGMFRVVHVRDHIAGAGS
jgi:CopA family copper-resistance protein